MTGSQQLLQSPSPGVSSILEVATGCPMQREEAGLAQTSAVAFWLQHFPDAGGQGLWCGALCCAAHRKAPGSHSTSCSGANGYKLQGRDTRDMASAPRRGLHRCHLDTSLGRHCCMVFHMNTGPPNPKPSESAQYLPSGAHYHVMPQVHISVGLGCGKEEAQERPPAIGAPGAHSSASVVGALGGRSR